MTMHKEGGLRNHNSDDPLGDSDNKLNQADEDDQNELKPNDQMQGQKHLQRIFDSKLEKIMHRVKSLNDDAIQLNKQVNQRNSNMVQNISTQIEELMSGLEGFQQFKGYGPLDIGSQHEQITNN